jgi:hypothetical protein
MPNIQIKRYTGSAWENVNPRTLAGNIFNAAGNTTIFDGNDKIKPAYLPDSVFDSLFFFNTVSGGANAYDLASLAYLDSVSLKRNVKGYYWVASAATLITVSDGPVQVGSFWYDVRFRPDDNGDSNVSNFNFGVEKGDWFILTEFSGTGASSSNPFVIQFAVVNNTYEDATTSLKGITRLSDATVFADLAGTDVITEAVLKATIDNAGFSASSHTHTLATGATDVTATASELNLLDGELITTTELNYLSGVTSAIQGQLNGKAATSHTHTVANITDLSATATELNVLDGITATTAELNYTDGVTSNIQTQLNGKAATSHTHTVANITDLTATAVELNYVDGVTSAIQAQLNAKAALASPTFTGTVSGITKAMVGLGNVDNTSDANKPISTATQTALNLKANLAGPTFTGTVVLPATTSIGNITGTEITYLDNLTGNIQTQLNALSGRVRVYYDGTPAGMVANDLWFDAI